MARNFDNPYSAKVIGLWDFRDGFETDDTGLGDGIAQDGTGVDGAGYGGGWLLTGGTGQRFDVDDGDDHPFNLTEGTICTEFRQFNHVGESTNTVVSRGSDGPEVAALGGGGEPQFDDGFFEIRVTPQGAVEVYHMDNGNTVLLGSEDGTVGIGDIIKVTYSWDESGVKLLVENTTTGTAQTLTSDQGGMTLDVTNPDEQSFAIAAKETTPDTFDNHFSGAVDFVAVLDKPVLKGGDGIVEGTAGDDDIDTAYTGDPEGDVIDGGDALLPGEGPDDDIVDAGNGDDTVDAGAGDDDVYGGGGSDSISGGDGDDRLEGDAGAPGGGAGGAVREALLWREGEVQGDPDVYTAGDDLSGGFIQDTGQVNVTFDVINESPGATTEFTPETQFVGNIDTNDGNPANPNSGMTSTLNGPGESASYCIEFDNPVGDVSFRVNDIDGDGVVEIKAFDADGNPMVVNLAVGPRLVLEDNDAVPGDDTAVSDGNYASADDSSRSMLVTIPGPVEKIIIDHSQDGPNNSGIIVSDVFYDVPVTDPGIVGDDTLDGGDGDDVPLGNGGDDLLIGGDGNDSADGGDGDDDIDTRGNEPTPLPDRGFAGYTGTTPNIPPVPVDSDPFDDRDTVDGGEGNDTIRTGDDNDVISGGGGNDMIDAGIDDDLIDAGAGDDLVVGSEGNDTIVGGDGADTIYGGLDPVFPDGLNIIDDQPGALADPDPDNGRDDIDGGDGNDVIYGQDDDDTLQGGAGDDLLDGGIDDDEIHGGDGEDTIVGGQGVDTLTGGFGSDTFQGANPGDTIVGGEDPDGRDIDTLDLTNSAEPGGSLRVEYAAGDPEAGQVIFYDGAGAETGRANFAEIENVIVPCFTPGTLIATPKGERKVEDLQVGDRVITRDNGIQEIRWMGKRSLTGVDLDKAKHLKPVLIRQGALGNGLPERDMMVSPNHRVLVANDKTALYFEEREVLVAAKHLTGLEGVDVVETPWVTYIHFMFDQHEVVLSDGAWTESFQPGDQTLDGLGNAQRNEIFELFPELMTPEGRKGYQSARRSLKKHEAQLLTL